MSQSTPTKHDGRAVLFAVAELLVSESQHNLSFGINIWTDFSSVLSSNLGLRLKIVFALVAVVRLAKRTFITAGDDKLIRDGPPAYGLLNRCYHNESMVSRCNNCRLTDCKQ